MRALIVSNIMSFGGCYEGRLPWHNGLLHRSPKELGEPCYLSGSATALRC